MSAGEIDPARCPLCGEDNRCGAVAKSKTCWCWSESIARETLERVPSAARDLACICKNCAVNALSPLGLPTADARAKAASED